MASPYEIGRRSDVIFDLVTDKFYRCDATVRTVRGFEVWTVAAMAEASMPGPEAQVTVVYGVGSDVVPIGLCTVRELGVCPNSYSAMGVSLEWKEGRLRVNGKVLPKEAVTWLKEHLC